MSKIYKYILFSQGSDKGVNILTIWIVRLIFIG